jgi:hypothetical protein
MRVLRREEVIDSWGVLIGGGKGRAEDIFQNTVKFMEATKVPDVKIERRKIAPAFIRGLLGTKRDFLVLRETENPRLKPFQMFISARDYGNNLDVSWYLTRRASARERILAFLLSIPILNIFIYLLFFPFGLVGGLAARAREKRVSLDLDLFDEQDLRAYVTNAHHCLIEAVEKLMMDLNQDPSKIDRRSRGFLGIS